MNSGKTLFAQLMDFLPWSTFTRIVARYGGDQRVRTLSCAEQYRAMAFAQLTYRESLRDIETCLSAQAVETLCHGLPRSGAALDAGRCQRGARLAHLRGVGPATDRPGETAVRQRGFGFRPRQHGLCARLDDHRSLSGGLSVGAFPHDQGGGQDAHAAGFARQHPELHPRIGRQAARRPRARPAAPRGGRHLRHGSRLRRFRPAPWCCIRPAPSSSPAPNRTWMPIGSIRPRPTGRPASSAIRPSRSDGHYTSQHYPEHLRRIRFRDAETGKTLVFLTNQFGLPAATICALYKSRWQVELFFKWIKQHLRIKRFFGTSENAVKTQIWIAVSVYVLVAIVKKRLKSRRLALHIAPDPLGHTLRENADRSSAYPRRPQRRYFANN